jgi:hexokinase
MCSGVVKNDVGRLLNEALTRKNVNVTVSAIVNDTVGTLMAHAYNDPQTYIGVILGTGTSFFFLNQGTNAAYVERVDEIEKSKINSPNGEMIINTEWGAYNESSVLPITKYDQALDRASSNPKSQIFEKMISGMYLGEITRLILMDLISTGELFAGEGSKELRA